MRNLGKIWLGPSSFPYWFKVVLLETYFISAELKIKGKGTSPDTWMLIAYNVPLSFKRVWIQKKKHIRNLILLAGFQLYHVLITSLR